MSAFKRVMLAFGQDTLDGGLLLQLRELARAPGLQAVHAVTVRQTTTGSGWGLESAAAMVDRLEQEVRGTLALDPAVSVTTAVLEGPILDALLGYIRERQIDLAIIGHRRSALSRALARRLARHAPCAVWMVPEVAPRPLTGIVVPMDFSEAAVRALDTALDLCRDHHLPDCLVLNVISRLDHLHPDEGTDVRGREKDELHRVVDGRDTSGVKVRLVLEEAKDVASGVAAVVARTGASLVCMGARGRSRAAAILLGSATEDVLERASIPVLVVRAPGPPLSLLQVLAQRVFSESDRPRSV